MSPDPTDRATLASRMFVASLVVAFMAAGLLAFAMPVPAAAPSAPWFGPNIMVNAPPAYSGYQSSIAVDANGVLHLAYGGWGGSTTQADIFFSKSSDGGRTWSAPFKVNNDIGAVMQVEPSIFVGHNSYIYIAWTDMRSGNQDIYFSRSFDGGLSFSANVRVNDVTANFQMSPDLAATWSPNFFVNDDVGNRAQSAPDVAVDGAGNIYVAWSDSRDLNTGPDIYAARSTNGGASFTANVKVNDDAGATYQGSPSLSVNAGRVHAAWTDERTRGSSWRDIYSASSADGLSWGPSMRVNDDALPMDFQDASTIAVDASGDAYVAWTDGRTSGQDGYTSSLAVVAPVANAGADRTVDQGASVVLDASASTDNLGIASYAWTFGDGTTGTGPSMSHAYATPGTYTAMVTVTDRSGNAATSSARITVRDTMAPTARGAGDRTVDEGQPLFFDASASSDNVGVASVRWDFGDNSTVSTQAAVTHVYSTPGTYSGSLTVADAEGNSQVVRFTVTVRAVSPKNGELLDMIHTLDWILAALAVALAFVGFLAITMWRRKEKPPEMVMHPGQQTQLPPPPSS